MHAEALDEDHDIINGDDLNWWIATDTDMATFTIDPIEHLASIRRLMPHPTWR